VRDVKTMSEDELAREVVAARRRKDGARHDEAARELAARSYDYVVTRIGRFRLPEYPTVRIPTDDVLDVAQDAWLRTVQMLSKLDDPAAFRGALKRTIFNTCLDWCRRDLRHDKRRGGSLQDTREGPDGDAYGKLDPQLGRIAARRAGDVEHAVVEADRLRRALGDLDDRRRTVVQLTDQGYSSKEIGAELCESVDNVDQLRRRAYIQLRKDLSDDHH
jgi:RNA polymerase sigma-70 factor (ECF subfamily)